MSIHQISNDLKTFCHKATESISQIAKAAGAISSFAIANYFLGPVAATSGAMIIGGAFIYSHFQKEEKISISHPKWRSNFLKNIPKKYKEALVEKILNLKDMLSSSDLTALKNLDIDHTIFQNQNWPYLAFSAYFKNKLTKEELFTLMQYNDALRDSIEPVKMYQLFDKNGEVNQKSRNLLIQATQKYFGYTSTKVFSDQDIDRFIAKVKELGLCDKFFVVTLEKSDIFENIADVSRLFILPNSKNNELLVLPVPLKQHLYDLRFGKDVMKFDPILGLNKKPPLSKTEKRVVSAGFIETFHKKIHGKDAAWTVVTYHDDSYHLVIECFIGKLHRELWSLLQGEFTGSFEGEIRRQLLDRELRQYIQNVELKSAAFWSALVYIIKDFKNSSLATSKKEFIEKIIEILKKDRALFEKTYQISFQNIQDQILQEWKSRPPQEIDMNEEDLKNILKNLKIEQN